MTSSILVSRSTRSYSIMAIHTLGKGEQQVQFLLGAPTRNANIMQYWGYHLILDCGGCDRELMSDAQHVERWIRQLVQDIGMQPIGEPRIEYTAAEFADKAGFTVVQVIVTSSIVAHFVDNLQQIYLDVFSCKQFDYDTVKHSMQHWFGAASMRQYSLTRQAD